MPPPRPGGLFLPGMMPGARSSRYVNPRYEELRRQKLEELGASEYDPRLALRDPAERGIDIIPEQTPITEAEALTRSPPQTMPLPGTLAYEDVVRRQIQGDDISKAANDRRAGISESMTAMPSTPAAIPPEVAQYARERVTGIGEMPTPAPGTEFRPPAKEQFELQAEDAQERQREEGLERSRNVRGLAESLELLGRSIGGISGGYTVDQPLGVTRGLDEQIARQEDYVPLATRRMLESKGIKVPEGARLSDLERVLPFVTRLTEQQVDEDARAREAQMKAVADMEKAAKPKEMSDKELGEIQQIDDAIRGMQQIASERKEKGYWTGPIDRMGAWVGEKTGTISAESAEWRRKVMGQLNEYIRAMTGAQLSKEEAARLTKALPTEGDQEYIFDAKIEGVIRQLQEKRASFLKTRRWAGKKTEPFEPTTVQVGGDQYAVPIGELREWMNAQQ